MADLDPNHAPPGYIAVLDVTGTCDGCALKSRLKLCVVSRCNDYDRPDGHSVIFKPIPVTVPCAEIKPDPVASEIQAARLKKLADVFADAKVHRWLGRADHSDWESARKALHAAIDEALRITGEQPKETP